MFQESFKGISKKFQGRLKGVSIEFLTEVYKVFQECFKEVLRVSQGRLSVFGETFKGDSRELQGN